MATGSHHGDPMLTDEEYVACQLIIEWIDKHVQDSEGTDVLWLPSRDEMTEYLAENANEETLVTLEMMLKWIRTVRDAVFFNTPPFIPSRVDLIKSRLFWRIRSGKEPLKFPPPCAYSCPWYELIDEPERAHWAYECYVHKPGDDSFWGTLKKAVAHIAQTAYTVETWSDEENSIPETVSFGEYLFKVFKGPFETMALDTKTGQPYRKNIEGWWIQYIGEKDGVCS